MTREHTKFIKKRNRKQKFLFSFFMIVMIGLFLRTAYIYVTYGHEYQQIAIRQQVYGRRRHVDRTINPNRGSIVDRNGQVLAISHTVYNIFADIRRLSQASEREVERTLEALYEVLGIDKNRMLEYIEINPQTNRPNRDTYFLILERQVPPLTESSLREHNLLHIHSEEDTLRVYPSGETVSSIIGFLSGDNNHWGLENSYNHFLTGTPGREVRMFNENGVVATNEFRPLTGYTLVTTLDLRLMQTAMEIAQVYGSNYHANTAQVLIMNPNTGEILAMAQYPSFNSNAPFNLNYINSERVREEIYETEENLRLNRLFGVWANLAISHSFEPGSIFKPMVHAAALEEGLTYPGQLFFCPGFHYVAGYYMPCWNEFGCGTLTLEQSMSISCNIVSMVLAERLGRDRLYTYMRDFGVGQTTGIDLSGEASVMALTYSRQQLNPVEIATSSFGQGFNMTSLQTITAFSAVINGGNVLIPYLVSQVTNGDNIVTQNTPTVRRNVISLETSQFWRDSMVGTLEWYRGTGRIATIDGYRIGGKTGTAQQGERIEGGDLVFSFIGYLPANDPQYVVMVTLDRPQSPNAGTASVSRMLRDVMEAIILQRGVRPYGAENLPQSPLVNVEDYTGLYLIEVATRLQEKGLSFSTVGSGGRVVNQQPLQGSTVARGTQILLYLSDEGYQGALVQVPDLNGMEVQLAIEILQALNLSYNVLFLEDEEGTEPSEEELLQGTVGNHFPNTGTRVPLGTEITIISN